MSFYEVRAYLGKALSNKNTRTRRQAHQASSLGMRRRFSPMYKKFTWWLLSRERAKQKRQVLARVIWTKRHSRASHGGFSKSKGKNDAELLPATTTAKLGPVIELRLVISTGMGKCWVHWYQISCTTYIPSWQTFLSIFNLKDIRNEGGSYHLKNGSSESWTTAFSIKSWADFMRKLIISNRVCFRILVSERNYETIRFMMVEKMLSHLSSDMFDWTLLS